MVKIRLSVSIEDKTWHKLAKKLRDNRRFRNKSHFVEEAILRLIEEKEVKQDA